MNILNAIFKRIMDIAFSILGLLVFSLPLIITIFLIWGHDSKSPFYVSIRVGKDEKPFKIVKLRTMIVNADKKGVDSTATTDSRITPIGHFVRRYKLDEITQLWNVLKGDMSLVGPRPNVKSETDIYTSTEKKLLSVKPGITDFASIVFSDEGEILAGKANPDIAYNQLIRPGKSSLGLFYIKNRSLYIDVVILVVTILSIFSRSTSLRINAFVLKKLEAPAELITTAKRKKELFPKPPPGSSKIVRTRKV
jgi:lipopolysaccharide/colanic/teichoic acid biosynthesis glycosyltransferase